MTTHLRRRLVAVTTAALMVFSLLMLLADSVPAKGAGPERSAGVSNGGGVCVELVLAGVAGDNEIGRYTPACWETTTTTTRPEETTTTTRPEVTTTTSPAEVLPTVLTTTTAPAEVLPTQVTLPFTGPTSENTALIALTLSGVGILFLVATRAAKE